MATGCENVCALVSITHCTNVLSCFFWCTLTVLPRPIHSVKWRIFCTGTAFIGVCGRIPISVVIIRSLIYWLILRIYEFSLWIRNNVDYSLMFLMLCPLQAWIISLWHLYSRICNCCSLYIGRIFSLLVLRICKISFRIRNNIDYPRFLMLCTFQIWNINLQRLCCGIYFCSLCIRKIFSILICISSGCTVFLALTR